MGIDGRAAPPVSEAEAIRAVREVWGLDVRVTALPGEHDDNFRADAADGRSYVLKVMHPDREEGFVDLQVEALRHLARRAPHLPLPRVCPVPGGGSVVSLPLGDGRPRSTFLLTYLPGTVLARARPHAPELLFGLGRLLGELDSALADFSHPAAHRDLKWDLSRASWIREVLHHVPDRVRRGLVERFLALFETEALPSLPRLRRGVVHGDANDHNVLAGDPREDPRKISGLIDLGDMHHGLTVSEVAIAAAYALLGKTDPLPAAARVVAGYHSAFPLEEVEIGVLFPLIAARLAVSVANSAWCRTRRPGDPYVTISETPAWEALERLAGIHPRLAHYVFREACGLPPVPRSGEVVRWLRENPGRLAPVLGIPLSEEPCLVFDLSAGSRFLGADPRAAETDALTEALFREMRRAGVRVGVGRYDEPRALYASPAFGAGANPTDEHRTVHLGIDLFVPAGTPVHASLDGTVRVLANNAAPQDYGPLVVLGHETDDGKEFFTLHGHLSLDTLTSLSVGQEVSKGQEIGRVGAPPANGDWPPHLHLQIIVDLLEADADFPGVAYASQRAVWKSLSPDPNVLLGIPARTLPGPAPASQDLLLARRAHLGRNLSVSYSRPLQIVRGFLQYLHDETGRAFLDLYNNVPLVGHGHPRVVRAAQEQLALLNTNTRYLHENVCRYAERLASLLPEPLSVCTFVNSGSEANELALRLARAHTGRDGVVVLEHAYHGHTTTLVDASPYKFDGPGGKGRKPWVHVAPLPDDYRGRYRRGDPEAGKRYAEQLGETLDRTRAAPGGVAAFLAESLPSVAGQIVFPPGYLSAAYARVRAAGGLCIADEVQVGFGRFGTHFWGFETQGVVPDIVVLGKPIGNGFPLAAVVTTPEIAASFDNGMEFFSTFGGNPVACAAGLAVLDVLEEERLQERALRVGRHLVGGLLRIQERHALVGDVRGSGLFLGIDLVRDRETREPATSQASYVVNRLRDRGILTGTDGPRHNVIKLRPPLVVSERDADLFLTTLDEILGEDAARRD